MSWRAFGIALLLLPCLALVGQGQTYQIKIKETADVGKKVDVKVMDKSKEMAKVTVMGMVVKEDLKEEVKDEAYTDIVLEQGDPYPKKLKRIYSNASITKSGKEGKAGYHGLTLIFELNNGKYTVQAEGGANLPAEEKKMLEKEANEKLLLSPAKLLPKKAIAVGESWKIDPNTIAPILGPTKIDTGKSEASGKLAKAYQKDGHQYGVVELHFKLALADLGGLKLPTPFFFNLDFSLDTAIDGSSTAGIMSMTGSMQGKADIQQMGQAINIELNVQAKGNQVQSAEH